MDIITVYTVDKIRVILKWSQVASAEFHDRHVTLHMTTGRDYECPLNTNSQLPQMLKLISEFEERP